MATTMLRKVFKVQQRLFTKHLLLTNVTSGMVIGFFSDIVQQKIKIHRQGLSDGTNSAMVVDIRRASHLSLSTSILSVEMHFWYKFLDRLFPTKALKHVLVKVCCDELIMAPNFCFTMLASVNVLEGSSWIKFTNRLKNSFLWLYLADVAVYTPVQLINFYFLSTKYRTVFVYAASAIYLCLASYALHDLPNHESRCVLINKLKHQRQFENTVTVCVLQICVAHLFVQSSSSFISAACSQSKHRASLVHGTQSRDGKSMRKVFSINMVMIYDKQKSVVDVEKRSRGSLRRLIFNPEVRPKTTNYNDDIYQVHVLLKEGGNLVAKDFSGSSDPYVKFKYKGKQVHKTKIVYQNLNPSWGERFVFIAAGLQTPLVIQVYDYDRFASDDFMGSANLYLKPLKLNTAYELKVLLTDNTSDSSMGYLLLQIMVSPFTEDDVHNINYRAPLINSEYFKKASNCTGYEWLSVLHISLIEGRGFCPISTVQGITLPDLYVRFKLETEKAKSRSTQRWKYFRGSIDLITILERNTLSDWFDLCDAAGQLFLVLSLSNAFDSPQAKISPKRNNLETEEIKLAKEYSLANTLRHIRNIGCLIITVCRAKGLAAANIGGKSDPFCVLEMVNTRFQTRTEYKTVNPEWNKTFVFDINDMYSILHVTIYDEDPNSRNEFLGKVAFPLIQVKNGERRWYQLKDQKLKSFVKGRIQLETKIFWNPVRNSRLLKAIRASIRVFTPKESKYIYAEEKFKRQIFMQNVNRLKESATSVMEMVSMSKKLLSWETPLHSVLALIGFILVVYFIELYMIPLALLGLFAKDAILSLFIKKQSSDDEKMVELADVEENEETEEKKSLREKLAAVQDAMSMVQKLLGYIAELLERIQNTFNFTDKFLSKLACFTLFTLCIALYFLPLRFIIILWGINKFTKKLRNPMADQNNELLDFLSRVPTTNELAMYMNEAVNESSINQKADLKVAVTNNNNNNVNKKFDVKKT
ncbi:Multiple C2 and transmembrane domain-containing protein 2 [Trichinella zimbabwensis]|uniref:Multiple C2 and transmembrane domain-containing protein 2 n=1 Tax=Trichinella zimbabwensis TaxID=268475 RepID=A0A0V1HKA7_9BILA|nr:Multiple C2 and transmembrane domain-containing protein 2 [Trichinella zimbabwensis]